MDPLVVGEAIAGGALLYVVPGFAVAKALWPDRRIAGPNGVGWALELAALSFVLSVVFTITVGYVLLGAAPSGFAAGWSDPILEEALTGLALVAGVAGLLEGAYARTPPLPRATEDEPGGLGAWELSRALDRLARERAALETEQRRTAGAPREELGRRIERIAEEETALRRRREAEYER